MYGPEIYGNEFKWSDPHSQELVFVMKCVRFFDGYLGLVMKMCTLIIPLLTL